MKKKALSLMAAAALGMGALTATPAGNQAQAEGFGFWIDFGQRGGHHARDHRRHRFHRVHPRVVRHQLRRRGYHHIRQIRFHRRAIHRGGRRVRGFYTARAVKHGRRFQVYVDRRGRPFARRYVAGHGRRFGRVHPRVVRVQLRRRGYHHIRRIRFHRRVIHRGGHRVRGFYSAYAIKRGNLYRVLLNRRGRPFHRRYIR